VSGPDPGDTDAVVAGERDTRRPLAGVVDRTIRFGVGPRNRGRAIDLRDELRGAGTPAGAQFRPDLGGWVVLVYHGWLQPPDSRPSPSDHPSQ
jgi:hypothetical protein